MNFFDFEDFFLKIYDNDFNYIKTNEYYGFRLVFFKESFLWDKGLIYPIYPWNLSPLKNELLEDEKEREIQSNIQKLEIEIMSLKKEIEDIKKK